MGEKHKKDKKPTKDEVVAQQKPQVRWTLNAINYWVPIVFVANISIPLKPRSFRGYHKNERKAIMTFIGMALSDAIFGAPNVIHNPRTGAIAINPDFGILPFYEKDATGEYALTNPAQFEEEEPEEENKIIVP